MPADGLLGGGSLAYGGFQLFAAQTLADDLAIAVNQECRRNALDAVFYSEFVGPAPAVEKLRPGHFLLSDEIGQLLFVGIEADANDFKTLVVMRLVGLQHIGQLSAARAA